MADNFREFGWDDEIVNEESFTLLPAGDYEFEVVKYDRARHEGSAKVPPCNKAIVTFRLCDPVSGQTAELTENFLLCSTLEWKLSQFFLSVGLKKHGEPLRMNWAAAAGRRGFCKVIVNKYMKDGVERENNRIDKFYAYDEQPVNAARLPAQQGYQGFVQPQSYQQSAQNNQSAPAWNGGSFGGNWNR